LKVVEHSNHWIQPRYIKSKSLEIALVSLVGQTYSASNMFQLCALFSVLCLSQLLMVASYTTTDASNLETALKTSYVSTVRPAEHMQVGVNAGLFHINTLVRDVFLLHNS